MRYNKLSSDKILPELPDIKHNPIIDMDYNLMLKNLIETRKALEKESIVFIKIHEERKLIKKYRKVLKRKI